MRRIPPVLLFLLAIIAWRGAAAPVSVTVLRESVAALTAPALAGRGAGTEGERAAARLMAGWLAEAGLRPAGEDGWFQAVPLADGASVNVLGAWPGRGALADRWLVIGAHLDHLGRVDPKATGVPAPGAYHPGAGDNASGVAVLRAVAGGLSDRDRGGAPDRPCRSVLVCAFGAEEIGLVGSRHLAANLPVPRERVDAMLNLDAVGRLGDGPLHVAGAGTCPRFDGLLARAVGEATLARHAPLAYHSDHVPFLEAGIPALFLFTAAYPEMNSPADSLAAVDLDGLETVARVTLDLVDDLRRARDGFAFSAPAAVAAPGDGNRSTWFGTAPDFGGAAAAAGYLIGGVSEGGPAARAGLRSGDVVVALGGLPVTDLATFTRSLRSFDPGQVVEVTVERGGRRLDFLVTLGDRRDRVE